MIGSSLDALVALTSSLSRASPEYERLPHAPRLDGFTTSGTHASVGRSDAKSFGSLNDAGITPMIVRARPFTWTLWPTMLAFPPKRRCHKPWLMTMTSLVPPAVSAGVKVRPIIAGVRVTSNRFGVADPARTSSGSCPPVKLASYSW